jgi:hypothetical protein
MTATMRSICLALAVVASAALLVPVGASAKNMTFGSSLVNEPANTGNQRNCLMAETPSPCTRVGFYVGNSGITKSPVTGKVVRFRVRSAAPGQMTFKLVRVRKVDLNAGTGQARAVATGPTVNVQGPQLDGNGDFVNPDNPYPIQTFKASVKVNKGDVLAIDSTTTDALYCANGDPGQLLFQPVLKPSKKFRSTTNLDDSNDCSLLVQAVVKPSKKKKK